jgi:hypothetical protein
MGYQQELGEIAMRIGRKMAMWVGLGIALVAGAAAHAEVVTVANPSFEDPALPPGTLGNPFVTSWNTPGPVLTEFPPGSGFFVNTNTGNFINTAPGQPDHIDNVDGNQAAFIAALSGNEFNQTLATNFQPGKSYTLTVGVAHNYGGGNPAFQPDPTAKVTLSLFYTDATGRHVLASRDVVNDALTGLSATHLIDFSAITPIVVANDPSIGHGIGIAMTTTSPVANSGGFFDLDNVRVTAVPEPASVALIAVSAGALLARRRRV